MLHNRNPDDDEPTRKALTAIEAEWPVIEAEMAVLDAEIRLLSVDRPSALDWRRLRRAEARVTKAAAEVAAAATRTAPRQREPRVDALPAPADLAEFRADWPLIAAELHDTGRAA